MISMPIAIDAPAAEHTLLQVGPSSCEKKCEVSPDAHPEDMYFDAWRGETPG